MQKIRGKEWSSWKRLVFAVMFLFCFMEFLILPVKAAEVNAPLQELEDVYITGFFSGAPDQALHWRGSETAKYTAKYFFLPAGADSDMVTIYFGVSDKAAGTISYGSENGYVTIDGKQYHSGDTLNLPESGDALSITYGNGITLDVGVYKSANIPSMFIQTESGSMDAIDADTTKATKEKGNILVICADGTLDYQGAMKQIKAGEMPPGRFRKSRTILSLISPLICWAWEKRKAGVCLQIIWTRRC